MKNLFSTPQDEPDIRAAFFAMASLMMILLPTLLMVTNPQKLVSLPLSLKGNRTEIKAVSKGMVEKMELRVEENGFRLTVAVRKTDVLASSGNTETQTWDLPDFDAVKIELKKLQVLDPDNHKIYVKPLALSSTQELVQWMDALQIHLGLTEVVLEHP